MHGASAPVALVAERAGTGIGSLYRRYPTKEALLQHLCVAAMLDTIEAAEAALTDRDPWRGLTGYLERAAEARQGAFVSFGGTIANTDEMNETFRRSQQALAEGGRMVSAGRSGGEPAVADEALAAAKNQKVVTAWGAMGGASNETRARALAQIVDLVAAGTLKVVIDRVFPLSETAAAHRHLAGRNQFGKVLLRP